MNSTVPDMRIDLFIVIMLLTIEVIDERTAQAEPICRFLTCELPLGSFGFSNTLYHSLFHGCPLAWPTKVTNDPMRTIGCADAAFRPFDL